MPGRHRPGIALHRLQLMLGPARPRPNDQFTPSSRISPDTLCPMRRSSTGFHGTRVKSRDRSSTANRPERRSTRRR